MKGSLIVYLAVLIMICGLNLRCTRSPGKLPILGSRTAVTSESGSKRSTDTIYHTISAFKMLSQDNTWVDNSTFKNKIYVADFFFTSCPTICPVMQRNMLKLAHEFSVTPQVNFLSYSIDPSHDSVHILYEYARRLGASPKTWYFLTGNRDSVYQLAEHSYYATAKSDSTAPGGFVHSGAFILVDTHRRIRGIYDGTLDEDVTKLENDIKTLIDEEFPGR